MQDETLPGDRPTEGDRGHSQRSERSHDTTDMSGPPQGAQDERIPQRLGRYRVRGRIGAGGMGVVLEGHDEQLDRPVAIKLLRGRDRPSDRARLLREAQALAQLSHPHVVQVFEVGAFDGRAYLVMERIDGVSLSQWLRAEPRSVAQILGAFVQAGEGLAAAHTAGFVHRDFKPGNVLVGHDGRVRVLDFGLARASNTLTDPEPDEAPSTPPSQRGLSPLWDDMTREGAMMGTPAYMSPEHLGTEPTTAASDQFSFCVALYEALFGRHPFGDADHWQERMHNVLSGQVRAPDDTRGIPPRARRAIVRGLAHRPELRWPSMRRLLRELRPRRRALDPRWLLAAGVATAGVAWAWAWATSPEDDRACTGAEAKLAEVWAAPQRAAVEQAMRGTGLSYAGATWARVSEALDDYAERWRAAHARACEARAGDPQGLDRAMACLERARQAMRAQVEVLAEADAVVLNNAVSAARGLHAPRRCLDVSDDGMLVPRVDDPALVMKQEVVMHLLEQSTAQRRSGRIEAAVASAEQAVALARTMEHAPTEASTRFELGAAQRVEGSLDDAIDNLEQAFFLAQQSGHERVLRAAAIKLVEAGGLDRQDYERGMEWARHAEAALEREDSPADRLEYLNHLGVLFMAQGHYQRAQETFERGLDRAREDPDADVQTVAQLRVDLGIVLRKQGHPERAIPHQEQATSMLEQLLGAEHPQLAIVRMNLAAAYTGAQRMEDAERAVRRALAINEAAFGPEHHLNAGILNNLSVILRKQGRYAPAEQALGRALDLLDDDAQLHDRGRLLENMALLQQLQGHDTRSKHTFGRAVAALEQAGLDQHPDTAEALVMMAEPLESLQEYDEAEAAIERALSIIEASGERRDDIVLHAWVNRATLSAAQGRLDAAAAHVERVRALREGKPLGRLHQVRLDFVLARAYWGTPSRREEALARAREAADQADRLGPGYARLRAQIQAWRADHDPGVVPSSAPGP